MSAWTWVLVGVVIMSVIGIGFKGFVDSVFTGFDKVLNFMTSGKFLQSEWGKQFTQNVTKWLEPTHNATHS